MPPGRSFSQSVSIFCRNTKATGTMVMKKIGFDLFREVIQRTPVDTSRARQSWQISLDRVNLAVHPEIKSDKISLGGDAPKGSPPSSTQTASANSTLAGYQWTQQIYISNNLPYMEALEYGHSKQAPDPPGIVRAAIRKIQADLQAIIARLRFT